MAPDPSEILRTHEERQAAIEAFAAEGKSKQWIFGWWRHQMHHQDDPIDPARSAPDD